MKRYVHARLSDEDRAVLERLKRTTGQSESELLRRGLHLVATEHAGMPSAAALAGRSVGRFRGGPADLSSNPAHLEGFGE